MDAETLKALKASIAKWERNAKARKPENFKTGIGNCPLCEMFHPYRRGVIYRDGLDCAGCPVQKKTGYGGCYGTPYSNAAEAHDDWEHDPTQGKAARAAAREEVAFLKSLLPVEAHT